MFSSKFRCDAGCIRQSWI